MVATFFPCCASLSQKQLRKATPPEKYLREASGYASPTRPTLCAGRAKVAIETASSDLFSRLSSCSWLLRFGADFETALA
jgi:hypothetical protein